MLDEPPIEPITALLHSWQAGDAGAYDRVIAWAYDRMLAIASGFVARERLATEPAALVHEAYIRLRGTKRMDWRDRAHFFSFVANQIRRILIDQARMRVAQKRDGARRRVPLSDGLSWVDARGQEMLDLEDALAELEELDADKVRLVELHYLMGCGVSEIAELRGISDATVERRLRFARTWLYGRLHAPPNPPSPAP